MSKIKAVIFDMDGVISQTQHFHSDTESEILKSVGVRISPDEIIRRFAGKPDSVTFQTILYENNVKVNIEDLLEKKWEIMKRKIQDNVKAVNGVDKVIDQLLEHGLKLAVASASPHFFIEEILTTLHLKAKFQAICSGDEVKKGKPDPELFLLAAKRLHIEPKNCVVIEDARNGVEAAKNAGMKCIAITTTHDKSDLQDADKIIDSFAELDIDLLEHI